MITLPHELARVAFHEAGHAVVAHHLGFRVTLVTIEPEQHGEPGHMGLTKFGDIDAESADDDLRIQLLAVLHAGREAEIRSLRDAGSTACDDVHESGDDYPKILGVCGLCADAAAATAEARLRCKELLGREWGGVLSLVARLVREKTMHGPLVCECLRSPVTDRALAHALLESVLGPQEAALARLERSGG